MFYNNKDLKHSKYFNRCLDIKENSTFLDMYGFSKNELTSLDFTLICFFYTRFKAFKENYLKSNEERQDLLVKVDELLLELEPYLDENSDIYNNQNYKAITEKCCALCPYLWI